MLRFVAVALVLAALGVVILLVAGSGVLGDHEEPGSVAAQPIPADVVAVRSRIQRAAADARDIRSQKQILFGDLHVHTTFSLDAFFLSLPALAGEGAHPPADACDFARYCSALDFWSINDHAEGLTPRHWSETIDSIQQCNAVAGDPNNPDVVAFLGWEWTQVGTTPEDHYGHKNVIMRGIERSEVPTRPIAASGVTTRAMGAVGSLRRGFMAMLGGEPRYHDFALFLKERADRTACATGVAERDLPEDCFEAVETPGELFRRLDEWGLDSIVIPHGTSWGFYTPPGSRWDKQLSPDQHDPDRQTLLEIYSGHGNSEEYRDYRAVQFDEAGDASCPEPSPGYLPTCWRAGEIIRERCGAAGESAAECDARAATARENAVAAGVQAFLTVPGAEASEWLDAGQCSDCFQPSFNHRPGGAAQYIMALRRFDAAGALQRFEFGFMASSDNHTARPGTGYKERNRREMTEAAGPVSAEAARFIVAPSPEPRAESVAYGDRELPAVAFAALETERGGSFLVTGGLIAAHASGRDRDSIWRALDRREVYGTSGPRILLWFDLMNDPDRPDGVLPMGGSTRMSGVPEFRIRATGSLEQQPGCPDTIAGALSAERIHHLCRGECYNPGDERRLITRIEVVRIRPQIHPDEPIAPLIEDPWRVIPCAPDPTGCTVTVTDPEFPIAGRDALYYVRAIEEPDLAINADGLRCTRDADGRCIESNPCYGDYRTPYEDDCLAESEARAWSSPVFVG
ncbi:MAG: DUF3604 domain-containing protein, partial [Myxococcota bacterium]